MASGENRIACRVAQKVAEILRSGQLVACFVDALPSPQETGANISVQQGASATDTAVSVEGPGSRRRHSLVKQSKPVCPTQCP